MRKQDIACVFDYNPAIIAMGGGAMTKQDMECVFDNSPAVIAIGGEE
ncbi:MAG: hypothetical protein LIO96_01560 [Lachnospiraceae bacterium]|nr:hypothetical protein [Lachnospiraceae bacterium]